MRRRARETALQLRAMGTTVSRRTRRTVSAVKRAISSARSGYVTKLKRNVEEGEVAVGRLEGEALDEHRGGEGALRPMVLELGERLCDAAEGGVKQLDRDGVHRHWHKGRIRLSACNGSNRAPGAAKAATAGRWTGMPIHAPVEATM